MPALTTRRQARTRILAILTAELDHMIPEDESIPLKGVTFSDFEDQVETVARSTLPVILEERAALQENAKVQTPGRCPHCGSDAVYLRKHTTQTEIRSPHGTVVIPQQHARCRACNGSFSPSGS